MKLVLTSAFLLLFLAIATVVAAQNPQVDWIRGTDFSRVHTFTWAKAAYAIQDPDSNLGMARAVQDELGAKGVQYVDPQQKFDLFVTYVAKINQQPQNMSQNMLTLNVRIFDSRNDTVIWSAGGYIMLGADKAQNRRNARALLAEMFQKYPPQ
jgi:hypothetical protein